MRRPEHIAVARVRALHRKRVPGPQPSEGIGRPRLEHPYSFVLGESNYLKKWFSQGDSLQIPLDRVPEDQVSFTLGDSCAKLSRGDALEVLTKQMLLEKLRAFDDSVEKLIQSIAPYGYVEVQLWFRPE